MPRKPARSLAKASVLAACIESAPSVPLKRVTAPFQKVLGLGAEATTVRAERAALAAFASQHARGD